MVAYDLYPNKDISEFVTYMDLPSLLKESDVVSLHCPLTPETKYMINTETIALMKPGVVLINTSRGALVDSKAVYRALKSKHIGALGACCGPHW